MMHSWETHRLLKAQTSAVARIQDKTVHCVLFLRVPSVPAVTKSLFPALWIQRAGTMAHTIKHPASLP